MKLKVENIKRVVIMMIFAVCYISFRQYHNSHDKNSPVTMVMGGRLYEHVTHVEDNTHIIDETNEDTLAKNHDIDTFFRPSNTPALNNRSTWRYFNQFTPEKRESIEIPASLLSTPKDVVLNYYSLLREAANGQEGKHIGCGSIGFGKAPYPIAYQFLSHDYQEKLSYEEYLNTFENILHISLIKYREIPLYDNPNRIVRYFVEIETIGGSEKHTGNFTYYYGFVDLVKDKDQYKIANLQYYGEDYLCAPYHGWSHIAEASVQIRYGDWCSMIKELYPTVQEDYIKNIVFQGTDGKDYLIVFYQLTNDTDLEIAQYRKDDSGSWQLIKLEPEKCLEDKDKN